MLETLLKKAAHRCKMKGIVFKQGSQSMDLVCTPDKLCLLKNYVWHDILVNRSVREKEMEKWISAERKSFFK